MNHFEVSEFLVQAYLQVGENTQLLAIDLTFQQLSYHPGTLVG